MHFLCQLEWGGEVADGIRIVLSQLQLQSGFVALLTEETSLPAPHLEKGWLSAMRERLNDLWGCVVIKYPWAAAIQREHNRSLMEQFFELAKRKCVGATAGRLRTANELCTWLRVITIADLANMDRTCIP